ncbi:arsenate reductase family protein [Ruminococcus sp. OM08-13AT]|nr:arsenate reductase family protein [Ruminococcus sp. OM08-13AT]RGI54690.1 arsenate reductase family protein [Ruminococcus sp. OF05-2BH]
MLFIWYPKCSTCQKAKKWLNSHEIEYTERHIVEENPTYDELKEWHQKSGLPLKKFFNTSGMLYKEMKLKDKLPKMSEDEQLKLLATNGMLVKRPVLVAEDKVLVGVKEAEWLKVGRIK